MIKATPLFILFAIFCVTLFAATAFFGFAGTLNHLVICAIIYHPVKDYVMKHYYIPNE